MKRKICLSCAAVCLVLLSAAQYPNWQNLDLQKDSVFGISAEKAYQTLLRDKPAKKEQRVLVAVIDGGVDTMQEDLRSVIWTNPREIAGNGRDDDHNGHADDIHGWNFIGSSKGDVRYDNLELVRLIRRQRAIYDHPSGDTNTAIYRAGAGKYRRMLAEYNTALVNNQENLDGTENFRRILLFMTRKMGVEHPTRSDFQQYAPADQGEAYVQKLLVAALETNPDFASFKSAQIDAAIKHYREQLDYYLNIDFDPRPMVGDHYDNDRESDYGNPDVTGPEADHGTHVSGIIAADRDNQLGTKGVADAVWILAVRVVPTGDERDKDVANGIRYAADMGAKVINMSFGKGYSWDKKAVDEAVKYAISKDVLLVHAAGNEGKDLDSTDHFPNRQYADGSGEASAWIEVGASGRMDDSTLVASFSNYGKTGVDVFAPGVDIYSSAPGNKYVTYSGTSMAAPVVSGLAALIRSRYPKLSAVQVKEIILASVVKVSHPVIVKSQAGILMSIPFSATCVSGGVVNAWQALELAGRK